MIAKARSRTLENRWTQDRRDRPDLEDYRGCLDGLDAIEVFVSEDHSEAEAQRMVDEIFMRNTKKIDTITWLKASSTQWPA